ncbi:uncharacterized protein LOC129227652 isoform X2 [Uloborus diversus]|nr:uncharacterized protein LOC129227652 isoform X2 [Uloborus diversus]
MSKKNSVCELHFDADSIEEFYETKMPDGTVHRIKRGRCRIKESAVPTIFPNSPKYLERLAQKIKALSCPDDIGNNSLVAEDCEQSTVPEPKKINFYELVSSVDIIVVPSVFWGITVHANVMICAKWAKKEQNFCLERRVIIDEHLNVKVFLKEKEICDEYSIECAADVSALLQKVENYSLCLGYSENMKYALVTYADEDDAPGTIVSTNWIDFENEICWFPNVTTEKKTKLLLSRESPSENWTQCQVTILKMFNNYLAAVKALNQELASLDIDPERTSRKRRKRYIFLPDGSSCDEDGPRPAKQSPPFVIKSHTPLSPFPESPDPRRSQIGLVERTPDSALSITDGNASAIVDTNSGIKKNIQLMQAQQDLMRDNMKNLSCIINRIESKIDAVLELVERKPSLKLETNELIKLAFLPIGNEEEFQTCNFLLVKISSFRQSLLTSLSVAGGNNVKTFIFNVLQKLMLDDIAELYSFTGEPSMPHTLKNTFEKTEVYNLILEVCRNTFSDTKEPTVREAVRDWLRQAKLRRSQRESRHIKIVHKS